MQSFFVELMHGLGGTDGPDRLAELREPAGYDQALLAEMSTASPARCASALIANLVLRVGTESPAPHQLAKLSAGDRERILLAICARILGAETDLVAVCADCGETIEIPIRFRDLAALRPAAPGERCALAARDGAWTAEIAPPTGAVLEQAMHKGPRASRHLLEACLTALFDAQGQGVPVAALPRECEAELAENLLALDPLAECRIAVVCPHCAAAFDTLLDAFSLLRSTLGNAEMLYGDVYRMARAYHWSEADILALPLAKRARYLATAAAAEAGA